MNLTQRTLTQTHRLGADLVGVAEATAFTKAPNGVRPTDLLPKAKSVIVTAVGLPEGVFSSPVMRPFQLLDVLTVHYIDRLDFELSRFLEREGYPSLPIPSFLPMDLSEGSARPDLSLKRVALEAGLGEMGLNGLVLTPGFGPRIRLGAVVTTAPLTPSPKFGGKLCPREACGLCVEACPPKALDMRGGIDRRRCVGEMLKYGHSAILRHIKEIISEGDPAKRDSLISSQKTREIFYSFWGGGPPTCHLCTKVCPVGAAPGPEKG